MNRVNQFFAAVLGSSLLWGGLCTAGFYALVTTGTLPNEFFHRYFASHWVLYVETTMFFVGAAALLIKLFDLSDQRARLAKPLLGELPAEPLSAAAAGELLSELDKLPYRDRQAYLPRRLRETLESIVRCKSADHLDEELKYLSEVDRGRAHASYAMLRILIWATPILGFLGTVIGITMAIANLNPQALESSLTQVTSGLGVAFDTTALALALSMILMFGQFALDRFESRVLEAVDERALKELTGRFQAGAAPGDPQLAPIEQLAETLIDASARLVERQAAVWRESLEVTNRRWSELTSRSGEQVEQALARSLKQSLEHHAQTLAQAEADAAQRNRRYWSRLRKTLESSTQALATQQTELTRQGEIMVQLVDATGQVKKLEESLNDNLNSLAGAQQLQETLLNLSAAINLLHARLGQLPAAPKVALKVHEARQAA